MTMPKIDQEIKKEPPLDPQELLHALEKLGSSNLSLAKVRDFLKKVEATIELEESRYRALTDELKSKPEQLFELKQVSLRHPELVVWAQLTLMKNELLRLERALIVAGRHRKAWIALIALLPFITPGLVREYGLGLFLKKDADIRKALSDYDAALKRIEEQEKEQQKAGTELARVQGEVQARRKELEDLMSKGRQASEEAEKVRKVAEGLQKRADELAQEVGRRLTPEQAEAEYQKRLAAAKTSAERVAVLAEYELGMPPEVVTEIVDHVAIQESTGKPRCGRPWPLAPGCAFYSTIMEWAEREKEKVIFTHDGRAVPDISPEKFKKFAGKAQGEGVDEKTIKLMGALIRWAQMRGEGKHKNPFADFQKSRSSPGPSRGSMEGHGLYQGGRDIFDDLARYGFPPDLDELLRQGKIILPGKLIGTTRNYVIIEPRE